MATLTRPDTSERSAAPPPTVYAALAGVIAAGAALAAGELVAAAVPGARAPVTSIGAVVIDLAPPALKDAAVAVLGTADKPVLIASVVLVLAGVAAMTGVLAVRRWWTGVAGVVALGLVGVGAAIADAGAAGPGAVLPAVGATVAGIIALRLLIAPLTVKDAAAAGASRADASSAESTGVPDTGVDRRAFLGAAAAVGAVAVVAGAAGRWLTSRAAAISEYARAVLPQPDDPLPPAPAAASLDVEGISPLVTPNETFYRIDTALRVPTVSVDDWTLRITGMVDAPRELTIDDLLAYEIVEADVTLACVSNEVGGDLVGNARWRGVRLADVLADAGVRPQADQLVGRAVDGFTTGSPLDVVLDGRSSLIAVGMNGEPLPRAHGFPARLVVPGLYGYVSATKWLSELELTTFDAFDAYWIPRGWAERAPIKTQSRIDVPRPGATVVAGRVAVAGVAWAQTRGITRVEVQVDDGEWREARLADELSVDSWRQWVHTWDATPGDHTLRVRATDGDGRTQTADRVPPRPDGATGHHSVSVAVTEA
ncbi:MAG TPA: molybdopterin-dependent oxidoreductase [Euzebyales bacterium]